MQPQDKLTNAVDFSRSELATLIQVAQLVRGSVIFFSGPWFNSCLRPNFVVFFSLVYLAHILHKAAFNADLQEFAGF